MRTRIENRVRFVVKGYSQPLMRAAGDEMVASILRRWDQAQDVNDSSTKPLVTWYERRKARRWPPAIRNLKQTGLTRGNLQTLQATPSRFEVGFTDVRAELRIYFNEFRAKMWGCSPRNFQDVMRLIQRSGESPIVVEKQAA